MSNVKDSKLNIEELNMTVKSLKDATHVSLVELEKNIQFTHQIISQFDIRLKQLENSIKFIQNNFHAYKYEDKDIFEKCGKNTQKQLSSSKTKTRKQKK